MESNISNFSSEREKKVLLRMEGINKSFPGVKALDDVSLTVKAGTVHALMGENGAGKSTLMKCLFGVYTKDSGHIYLEDREVNFKNSKEALENGVAMVHQELQPIPERSIGENIYVGRYPTKKYGPVTVIDHDKMYEDAAKVLKEVHLNYDPHAKLGTLSVSQMQLVEIAKAVSADCKVLILDEPANFVDNKFEKELYAILRQLNDRMAIIMVSHDLGTITSHVKSIVCVNRHVHRHNSNVITPEQLHNYDCPIQIVSHGTVPHTVLEEHAD